MTHNPFAAWQLGDPPLAGFVDRGLPNPPPPGSTSLVQVVGDSGLGKSTQLAHWRTDTPGPYHYVPRTPYRSRFEAPPSGDVVYGDEIDRMPALIRSKWFRSLALDGATLIIGTHTDLRRVGERAGFAVVTHHLSPVDGPLLEQIVNERLRSVSCGPLDIDFSAAELSAVLAASGGNPREADVLCHQLLADHVARR